MKSEIPKEIRVDIAICSACNKRFTMFGKKAECPHCKEKYYMHTDGKWHNEACRELLKNIEKEESRDANALG